MRTVLRRYADFSGRASRAEFWWWAVVATAVYLVLLVIGTFEWPVLIAVLVVYVATLVPTLAVTWRRLHDSGKTGLYVLFGAIPAIGNLILLFFLLQHSEPGDNFYGPEPT